MLNDYDRVSDYTVLYNELNDEQELKDERDFWDIENENRIDDDGFDLDYELDWYDEWREEMREEEHYEREFLELGIDTNDLRS